jgi:hypothetical protein
MTRLLQEEKIKVSGRLDYLHRKQLRGFTRFVSFSLTRQISSRFPTLPVSYLNPSTTIDHGLVLP